MKHGFLQIVRGLVFVLLAGMGSRVAVAQTQAPVIFQQPQSQIIAVGYTPTFSVGVTNQSQYPQVQWLENEQPIPGATNANFVFRGTYYLATYSITNTPLTSATYSVTLSNSAGSILSSNASLTVIPAYTFITMAGEAPGTNDGTGPSAQFSSPRHVAIDRNGDLYVTDYENSTIRKVTPGGVVSTFAGTPGVSGTNDGPASMALFSRPHGIAIDRAGNLFVTDLNANLIKGGTIREISTGGYVRTIAGTQGVAGTNDGPGSVALFRSPWGLAVDSADDVFVSDALGYTIREMNSPDGTNWTVSTIAGAPAVPGTADGTNNNARFNQPDGLALDLAGNLFVADENNQRVRMISPLGTNWAVSTIWNQSGTILARPSGVAVDANDDVFVAGQTASEVYELMGSGTNWLAAPIAGTISGTNDGTGYAAEFAEPHGIALDSAGNLYVVDLQNNNVRKGWSSDVVPAISLNPPVIGGGRVQLNFVVATGSPTNFTLWQAADPGGPWSVNAAAQLSTNVPGLNYEFSLSPWGGAAEFFRLQLK